MIICGIDPGLKGAVAVLNHEGGFLAVFDTPTLKVQRPSGMKTVYIDAQMVRIFRDIINTFGVPAMVGLEELHAMKEGTSSNFSCGLGSGLWRGIVTALDLPLVLVPPRTWKKAIGIPTGSKKGESIERALRLFPAAPLTLVKHDGRADAILIAEHIRRQNTVK